MSPKRGGGNGAREECKIERQSRLVYVLRAGNLTTTFGWKPPRNRGLRLETDLHGTVGRKLPFHQPPSSAYLSDGLKVTFF